VNTYDLPLKVVCSTTSRRQVFSSGRKLFFKGSSAASDRSCQEDLRKAAPAMAFFTRCGLEAHSRTCRASSRVVAFQGRGRDVMIDPTPSVYDGGAGGRAMRR